MLTKEALIKSLENHSVAEAHQFFNHLRHD